MKRFAILASLCAVLAFTLPAPVQAQDTCPGGLAFGAAHAFGPFDAYATLQDGTRVRSDGLSVDHIDAAGQLILHLGDYPGYVYPSFVLLAPDESFALVGESSFGGIERFELSGLPQSTVGGIVYNYDAVWEDATHVLVSADASGGFQNQIVRLDITNGATTLVAQLTGPSGPIARRARTGDVFIGIVDLGMPNNDAVLRFDAAQISGGLVLGPQDGALFAGQLANAASLRIDQRYDVPGIDFWRLYLAISPFGSGSTIACFDPSGTRLADVASSVDSISNLELQIGSGPGSFAPYQPDAGEQLLYRGTAWCYPNCTTAEIRRLEPRRPTSSISGPGLGNPGGGSVTVSFDGCVPNANVLMILGPSATYQTSEQTRHHPDGFLWHTGLAFTPLRRLVTLPTDAFGHASFTYYNNGSLNGTHAMQALVRDGSGLFVASSTCVLN